MERRERLHEEEGIREVLQQLEEDSDGLGTIESSDESIQDELIEEPSVFFNEVELEADPDYDPETSDDEESEVEEFDVDAVEEAIDNTIANAEENENGACNTDLPGTSRKRKGGNKKRGENRRRTDNADENDDNFVVSINGDLARGREDKDGNAFIRRTKPLLPESDKTPRRNVVHAAPGPVGSAREALEPSDCFSLFVTSEMLDLIMKHTNEEIRRNQNSSKDKTFAEINSVEELKALLGLLNHGAIKKDNL